MNTVIRHKEVRRSLSVSFLQDRIWIPPLRELVEDTVHGEDPGTKGGTSSDTRYSLEIDERWWQAKALWPPRIPRSYCPQITPCPRFAREHWTTVLALGSRKGVSLFRLPFSLPPYRHGSSCPFAVHLRESIENGFGVRVESRRFLLSPYQPQEIGVVSQDCSHGGVLGSKGLYVDLQGPLVKRLGLSSSPAQRRGLPDC